MYVGFKGKPREKPPLLGSPKKRQAQAKAPGYVRCDKVPASDWYKKVPQQF